MGVWKNSNPGWQKMPDSYPISIDIKRIVDLFVISNEKKFSLAGFKVVDYFSLGWLRLS